MRDAERGVGCDRAVNGVNETLRQISLKEAQIPKLSSPKPGGVNFFSTFGCIFGCIFVFYGHVVGVHAYWHVLVSFFGLGWVD